MRLILLACFVSSACGVQGNSVDLRADKYADELVEMLNEKHYINVYNDYEVKQLIKTKMSEVILEEQRID